MSTPEKGYNINQTFIIETNEGDSVLSACTALFTTNIYACTGNTEILLGYSSINMVGDVFVSGDLSATTVSATTYYGDGSNLTGISTQDTFVTGGTYSDGTAVFTNNTGGTFNVSGFYTGATDVFVTGGTYLTSASTLTFTNNTGGTFNITGITTSSEFTGGTVTGATSFSGGLTATTISATTYENLPLDITVTGGTYSDGTAVFTNNTGGTFNVSGFYTGATDVFVTGATYNNANTFTYTNNTGGTFNVLFNTVTGLTVNGDISVNSVSATTLYGNGSNITGINFSQLATTAHTHPISDVINLQNELDSKIDIPPISYFGDYLYYNGITWVPNQINIPVAAGDGVTLFLSVTGSSLPTYEFLSRFPIELTETQESITVNNNQALIGKYATDQLNRTVIDSGIWEFNTFASVDTPSTGLTQIIISAFLLTSGGSETFLFSGATENITTTSPSIYTFSLAEPQYSCNTTDYLVVNYSASTTNNFNTTVTLYHGGTLNYSHIHTPFITLHNDLAGIQGGFSNEHYHLSKNEAELLTTGVDSSSIHNHDSLYLGLGGGTVTGDTNFTTILSATTLLTSGITAENILVNSDLTIANNVLIGGGLDVGGNSIIGGDLNVNSNLGVIGSISATTYQNLPVTADTFVTGFTYDSINTFTIKQNEGQSDLTATINDLSLNSLSATTITSGGTLLQTIIQNIVTSSSPVYIRRHDFTGDTITSTSYCGTAPDGSLETQPFWDITKINIPLIGSGTTSTYASGVTWTGRYTHIYT